MIFEWDDLGCNHIISDQCQSHDCRDQLDKLHMLNSDFKCTLFAIPGEMTFELLKWCDINKGWVELAYHGIFHSSNYECEKMSYQEFDSKMTGLMLAFDAYFVHGFRAPGWQISDDIYRWLLEHNWWVADQGYNDDRRPIQLPAYINYGGNFRVMVDGGYTGLNYIPAYHGHTWDVGWNGIYEDFEKVSDLVKNAESFQFISELFV